MFTYFVCGNAGARIEEDEFEVACMGPVNRRGSNSNKKNKNNPYSTQGLDKFASVLADLEEKKQKIICKQKGGSQETLMVRFKGSDSKGWLPIVVRLGSIAKPNNNHQHNNQDKSSSSSTSSITDQKKPKAQRIGYLQGLQISERMKMVRLVVVAVLVMIGALCLVRLGRSFTVMGACVSSYLVPLMKDNGGRLTKAKCRNSITR
ncbi:hypothetical protein Sjap_010183 [Stephania japonica]|uniref:Transmembrane protein n=1 Tax=Stephania japonica TaxID=461633 RepID=A0AAP0J8Z6_9MAGN